MLARRSTIIMACRGWFLDSGATVHVTGNRGSFLTYGPVDEGTEVACADGHCVKVAGVGSVQLNFTGGQTVILQDVLHVPGIKKGLVSADKFDRNGYKLVFKDLVATFSHGNTYVGRAKNTRGMYRLDLDGHVDEDEKVNGSVSVIDISDDSDNDVSSGSVSTRVSRVSNCNVLGFELNEIMSFDYIACSISLWHKRLAHTNIKNIEKMQTKGLIKLKDKDFDKCETCVKSKFTKKPFSSVPKRKKETMM